MAEYNLIQTKKLAELFCKGYNELNNTNFSWDDKKSYQPAEPVDFRVFDRKQHLDIQLTRATSDPIREFILPNLAGKVVNEVEEQLKRDNLPPISLYVNFHNPPKSEEDVREAVFWLHYYINHKVITAIGLSYFCYDNSFDSQFLPKILKYITDINIWPVENAETGFVRWAFGWGKDKPEPWPGDDIRVINAAKKKKYLSKEVILLVDSGWSPISDYYIPLIKEGVKDFDLNEIWVIEDFSSQKRVFRIK